MQEMEFLRALSDMMDEKLDKAIKANNEMLIAKMSDMMDEKLDKRLKPIEERLDRLEDRMDRLEDSVHKLEVRMDKLEDRMDKLEDRMDKLETDVHGIHLCLENNVMPRLNTIEQCYTSTYARYRAYIDKMEPLFSDVDNLKKTVSEHSRILNTLTSAPQVQAAAQA